MLSSICQTPCGCPLASSWRRSKRFLLIGERDLYLDLPFCHRSLRRLVVIELKPGSLDTACKRQMELYLRRLDKYSGLSEGLNAGLDQVDHHLPGVLAEQGVVLQDEELWWFSSRRIMS